MAKREYRLGARAVAAERTRETILQAAEGLLRDRWFDEVTLADIAREAGVAQQTVVNHFGSKERLYLQGLVERVGPQIAAARAAASPGDVSSIVSTAVDEYERSGLGTWRMLALADRYETLAEAARYGREAHRDWVARVFAPQLEQVDRRDRQRLVRLLATVLDVLTWYQLRHSDGADVAATKRDLEALVTAVLSAEGVRP
jgi:AcrR family transcriptional regulator